MSTQVFTLANQLTMLRMLLVPVFVLLTLYGRFGWALLTFMFASMTDLLDGLAARKTSGKTDLGAWLDPIADKLLIYDALDMKFRKVGRPKDPACPLCGPNPKITDLSMDYAVSCTI